MFRRLRSIHSRERLSFFSMCNLNLPGTVLLLSVSRYALLWNRFVSCIDKIFQSPCFSEVQRRWCEWPCLRSENVVTLPPYRRLPPKFYTALSPRRVELGTRWDYRRRAREPRRVATYPSYRPAVSHKRLGRWDYLALACSCDWTATRARFHVLAECQGVLSAAVLPPKEPEAQSWRAEGRPTFRCIPPPPFPPSLPP